MRITDTAKIKLPYGYLLSNTPICIRGIGTAISPKLKVLYAENADNWQAYIFAQAVATSSSLSFIKIAEAFIGQPLPSELKRSGKFDIIIQNPVLRDVLVEALSLFFTEKVVYDDNFSAFIFFNPKSSDVIGCLNSDTFDIYCSVISQLMHIGDKNESKKEENPLERDLSALPPEVIHALEMFDKYSKQTEPSSSSTYNLDNIISKMCAANSGYNLLTIYDLTIFQLYDQFQAYSQNRLSALSERSFSIWGGEDFDYELWLKNNN